MKNPLHEKHRENASEARSLPALAAEILALWFGENPRDILANYDLWFKRNDAFDREIAKRFAGRLEEAAGGAFADWIEAPQTALAYIILTDQFSRNIHRDSARAYATDPQALDVCLEGEARGHPLALGPIQCWIFQMPLMHSEEPALQRRCVENLKELAESAPPPYREKLEGAHKHAVEHCGWIERFGRFPHRNALLGRESSAEELEFLKELGNRF